MAHILTKIIIILIMLAILLSLGSGLYSLLKGDTRSNSTVKALSWRIGLSLLLFVLLLVAFALGWISPHHV